MSRKSPVEHRVSGHTRTVKGKRVRVSGYTRGDRKRTRVDHSKGSRRRISKDDDGGGNRWEHFTVTLIYDNDTVETLHIAARDGDDALNQAYNIRRNKTNKIKTSIVQDGLGDVIKKTVRGVQSKYTKA